MTKTRSVALLLIVFAAAGCGGSSTTGPPVQLPNYQIEIRYLGTQPSLGVRSAIDRSVARIQSIIVGGVNPVALPAGFRNVSQCDATLQGYPDMPTGPIPGLVIYVRVQAIDGVAGVLGNAGPCLVRLADNRKPALGVMRLDEADLSAMLASGRLDALVLHELLHVVGFGTVWDGNGMVTGLGTEDARYIGNLARAACAIEMGGAVLCASSVPVHSADGAGAAYSHWRESDFTVELMTPFLNAGTLPLSVMTAQSLADMGYLVDLDGVDVFTLPATPSLIAAREDAVELASPVSPRYGISADGELVLLEELRRDE